MVLWQYNEFLKYNLFMYFISIFLNLKKQNQTSLFWVLFEMRNFTYKIIIYILIVNTCLFFLIQNWSLRLRKSYSDSIDPDNSVLDSVKRSIVRSMIRKNSIRCSHIPRPSPDDVVVVEDRWQVEDSGKEKVFIYSAFYDDRPLAGPLPNIRVDVIASFNIKMDIFCHLWYKGYSDEAFVVKGEIKETGMNRFFYEEIGLLFEFTVSCQLPFKNLHITNDPILVDSQYNSSCKTFFEKDVYQNPLDNNMIVDHENTLLVCNKLNINEKVTKLIPEFVSLSRDVPCKLPIERTYKSVENSQHSVRKNKRQKINNNNQHQHQRKHQKQQSYNSLKLFQTETTNTIYHTTLQSVFYEFHEKPVHEFSICVVNGHGQYKPQEMIEWFEFYRLMGVTKFNLYNTSYSGIDSVFKYYQDENLLVMSQIPHPLGFELDDRLKVNKVRNMRTVSLTDCLMRNMYRSKYLVVIDHDEFIVPRGNITNFHDLLIREEETMAAKDKPVMSFSFLNSYFLLTFKPDVFKSNGFKTLRFRHRTEPLLPYTGSKSILSPLFCFNLMNHYCYTRLPLYKGEVSHFVSEKLALNHHYRFCGNFIILKTCNELHGESIRDDSMLRFENSLMKNVNKVVRRLNLSG